MESIPHGEGLHGIHTNATAIHPGVKIPIVAAARRGRCIRRKIGQKELKSQAQPRRT